MRLIAKPSKDEYPTYASMYIDLLPDDGRVLEHLEDGLRAAMNLVTPLSEEQLAYRYAEGKWTLKQLLVHIVDDERIYAYRALRFARGDTTPLPGFEQDNYVMHSHAHEREIGSILAEYTAVRQSTIALFDGLPEEALSRGGVANDNFVTVRALVYHIAGHEARHLNIVRERYLRC
jgi:uncharacterized damage-inducible protein DinB